MKLLKWLGIFFLFVVLATPATIIYNESQQARSYAENWGQVTVPTIRKVAGDFGGPPIEVAKEAGGELAAKTIGAVAKSAGDALAKRYIEGRGGTVSGLVVGQVVQAPFAPAPAATPVQPPPLAYQPSVYQSAPTQPTPAVVAAEPRYEVPAEARAWYEAAVDSWEQAQQAYRALQRGSVLESNDLASVVQRGQYAYDFAVAVVRAAYPYLGLERAIEDALVVLDDGVATKAEAVNILTAYNSFLAKVDSSARRAEAREFRANYEAGTYLPPEKTSGKSLEEIRAFLVTSNNEARRAQSTGYVSPQDDLIDLLAGRCVVVTGKAIGVTAVRITHPYDLIQVSVGSLGQALIHRQVFESQWGSAITIGQSYCLPPKAATPVVVDMVGVPQVVTRSPGAPSLDLSRFQPPEEPKPEPQAPTPVAALPEAPAVVVPPAEGGTGGLSYEEWVAQQQAAKGGETGVTTVVVPPAPVAAPPPPPAAAAAGQGCYSGYMKRWVQPREEQATWTQKCVQAADGSYQWVSNK